ncbi:YcbK family protein [Chondromyces crocatus]|uniref:Peptidase M15A C-terminal domain-containing protein n=1 Tax=Chondromyces crocatus TaxID=52 RepID=A0A0K1EPF2_CHOCO|nr:D-Ala-D-Ala carboxypeptidase family metallohydrolase [Chondromyces crocatus]AKT42795.1 uncharacterized protein CMC5_070220 [Chondromyces crocatus]
MTALPALPTRWIRAAALGVAVTLGAGPAHANLLEQAPWRAPFILDGPAAEPLPLLYAFRNPAIERPGPLRLYVSGRYGRWMEHPWQTLSWSIGQGEHPETHREPLTLPDSSWLTSRVDERTSPGSSELLLLEELIHIGTATSPTWLRRLDPGWSPRWPVSTGPGLASNGYNVLWEPTPKPVRDWRCRRRPVVFARHGGEQASFLLVRCDGSSAPEALERLSIVARPPETPSPGELLPDEPDAETWPDLEWVPQVRVLHPRLLWVLQKIADAFPFRSIYIFSGYRPRAEARKGHSSLHAEGRALDIMVMGVSNTSLFNLCRTLDDVGCGFYPNSKFVHVDVRRPATGHTFWIDISGPGEPSRYVDAWPGVVDRGGTSWSAHSPRTTAPEGP